MTPGRDVVTTSRITDADIERVRKQAEKCVQGGGAYQAWMRIVEHLEIAQIAQDGLAEQEAVSHG